VASERQRKKSLKRLEKVKTWQLFVILVLMLFVAATFLRLNNIGMIERRNAVLSADEAGNDEVTVLRLYDLQRYISSHMNTDMSGGIYLESAYRREVKSAYDKASQDSNPNRNIYKEVQNICAPKFSSFSYAYIQCTTDELAKYPSSNDLVSSVELPKASAYRHEFLSPLWSPDFAGWAVLISVALTLMIIVRLFAVAVLRLILRRHYTAL